MVRYIYGILALLVLAAPLAAQEPGDRLVVIRGDSIYIDIDVAVTTDELEEVFRAMQASLDSATAALRDCDRCEEEDEEPAASSATRTAKIATGLFSVIGLLIVKYLRQIANKETGETNGDPVVELDPVDYDQGEGGEGR